MGEVACGYICSFYDGPLTRVSFQLISILLRSHMKTQLKGTEVYPHFHQLCYANDTLHITLSLTLTPVTKSI